MILYATLTLSASLTTILIATVFRISRVLASPQPSPTLQRKHQHNSNYQSMCKDHNWNCVSSQRTLRLGFKRHQEGSAKVLGNVTHRDSLCLDNCCVGVNIRLFGCVEPCCWGRVSLADRRCRESCCGGSGLDNDTVIQSLQLPTRAMSESQR